MAKNVMIIGAGAAGLTAAISAARTGANVTVLEAQERPGRKLLVTGNGRCNLTNISENLAEQYRGSGAALASKLLRQFDAKAALEFFHGLGLLTQEKNGYVYPYTAQASSVLDVLLAELRRLKVKLKFSQEITEIIDFESAVGLQISSNGRNQEWSARRESNLQTAARFAVVTPTWTYQADAVILACGSKAAPSTGASGEGYLLAQALGHTIVDPRPALVPLTSHASFLNRAAGVRCRAGVTLLRKHFSEGDTAQNSSAATDDHRGFGNRTLPHRKDTGPSQYEEIAQDIGELQWTNYGVSGIVIFQLSRYIAGDADYSKSIVYKANKANIANTENRTVKAITANKAEYALCIDFFPDYSEQYLKDLLTKRAAELPKEPVSVLLRGLLNEKLIPAVLEQAENAPDSDIGRQQEQAVKLPAVCKDLKQTDITGICRSLKSFYLPVTGTKSFDQAQICAGGVDCREITDELESRLHSGLYFAGEMLDVDGPCGGYNLQWAWTSGYIAGASASRAAIARK
ncbi:MAG: NAD(P)/FAD-dependent oxidoreductase [Lachnospiraceae bacterium]|nr:NAD(P)/FAD-dependent oxidoreductase [Lachnospiraceae bacterium]